MVVFVLLLSNMNSVNITINVFEYFVFQFLNRYQDFSLDHFQ